MMKNPMLMLFAFLAAFLLASPAHALLSEEDKIAADESKADESKADESKADEPKADEPTSGGMTSGGADEGSQPAEIKTDEEAFSAVEQIVSAAKGGQWSLVVAMSIMLLVYLLKRFGLKDRLPSKVVPWFAAATSMGGYVAASLMLEGASMLEAALGGLATGAAAVGLWEMVFKHFLGGAKKEEPAKS